MSNDQSRELAAERARLRRDLRARRLAVDPAAARGAALRAARRLWALPVMARAARIAVYLPVRGELDCSPVALEAWARGRAVFLPVLAQNRLRFGQFAPGADLVLNRFRIPEPAAGRRALLAARELSVIVAPLVAFDAEGGRLGMGGGYYDRTLAFLNQRTCARRPQFIGIAYDFQRVDTLRAAAWDVRLDAVVTESATYRFT